MNVFESLSAKIRESLSLPDDWQVFSLDCSRNTVPEGFIRIEGAVCKERYKRGKRAGAINYKKMDRDTVSVHFLTTKQYKEWTECKSAAESEKSTNPTNQTKSADTSDSPD